MTENDSIQTKAVEVDMLEGKINTVTVKVHSDFAEGVHRLTFILSSPDHGEPEIKRTGHVHPWGNNLTHPVDRYAADAKEVRAEAQDALKRRQLDDPEDWYETTY